MVVTATADSLPPRRLRPQEVKAPEVVLDRRHLDLDEAGVARIGLYRHEVVPVRERGIRCVPTLVPGPGLAPGSSKLTLSSTPLPARLRRAASIDAVSRSMPSTRTFGYPARLPQGTVAARVAFTHLRGWSCVAGPFYPEEETCDAASQSAARRRALLFMRRDLRHPLNRNGDRGRRLLELPSRVHRPRSHGRERRPRRALQPAPRSRRCLASRQSSPSGTSPRLKAATCSGVNGGRESSSRSWKVRNRCTM